MKRYLVVVADRQNGKFFTLYKGMLEDEGEEIYDRDVPQKVKAEHTRPGKVQNHIQEHLHKHLKHVGESAYEFVRKNQTDIDGVIVGGHDEMHSTVIKYLPKELAKIVVGKFKADTDMPVDELTKRALETVKNDAVHHVVT
jgi:peptide subunit release factor 1 (eRF1)